MDCKKYYSEHISYDFNKEKMQKIVSELKIDMIKKELENQYEKLNYCLFDKVNTKKNVLKYIDLLQNELTQKNK